MWDNASGLITAAFSGAGVIIATLAAYKKIGSNERVKTNLFAALVARWRDWAQTKGHWHDGGVPESLRNDTDRALDGDPEGDAK